MTKILKLNQFILKILGLVFMTFDHVGVFMMMYGASTNLYWVGYVFRCIGRLALPLFILFLVEGIRHTTSTIKYLSRIGILMGVLLIFEIIVYYFIDSGISSAESPLVDLFFCGLTLALLHRKDKWSFFAILPIAFIILTATVQVIELAQSITIHWLPFYIRPGYSLFGLALALGFYYSTDIVRLIGKRNNLEGEEFEQSPAFRSMVNIAQVSFLITINIVIYLLALISINNIAIFDIYIADVQTWSIAALVFMLCYNGMRGYNKPWFKYGTYLYFPLHIIIIFFIFYVIYM